MCQQLEAHKEEIQKSLKDIQENKGQQAEVLIEETQKSLKELEENANKQIKELRKTIQDLKRKQKQLRNDKGRQLQRYKTLEKKSGAIDATSTIEHKRKRKESEVLKIPQKTLTQQSKKMQNVKSL